MPVQKKYLTSVIKTFSTFLESLNISAQLSEESTVSFIKFLKQKANYDTWTLDELEKFLNLEKPSSNVAILIKRFIRNFTPRQTDIFLYEFLSDLKKDNKSSSTIKNYKSDISQLISLLEADKISELFTQESIKKFIKDQFAKNLKEGSVKRKLASIAQFAAWAENEKLIENVSFWISDVESLFEKKSKIKFASSNKNEENENLLTKNNQIKPELNQDKKTASEYLENFLTELKSDKNSKSTIKNYKSDISQLLNFSENASLSQVITQENLEKFISFQKAKGLKLNSIQRKLVSIAQFSTWAQANNILKNSSLWLNSLNLSHKEIIVPKTNPVKIIGLDRSVELKIKNNEVDTQEKTKRWSLPIPKFVKEKENGLEKAENEKNKSSYKTRLSDSLKDFAKSINSRNRSLLPYFNLIMIVLFMIGAVYFGYSQFIKQAPDLLAYPTSPVRPNRELSFQGRLTDTAQNPVTSATNMAFRLYDVGPGAGGTLLWDSSTCSVTPDQDGIFNVGLGDDCGAEIDENVFTENSNVWLEVDVAAETLTPRQSIKTVAYAINSETVQGYPVSATGAATINTIVVMDDGGQVILGEVSPTLKSTTGTFAIEAQTLMLQTSSGSNGDIIFDPDGLGEVLSTGYFSAPGATFSSTYAGGTSLVLKGGPSGTANIQEWQNSAGTALSVVDEAGNFGIGTNNPLFKLDVAGTASVNSLNINDAYTFPTADGTADYVLTTDGAGVVTWESALTDSPSIGAWSHGNHFIYPDEYWADDLIIGGNSTASATFRIGANGTIDTSNQTTDWTLNNAVDALNFDANTLSIDASNNRVGIGDASPASLFTVGSGDLFQINSSGIISSIDGVAHTIDDVAGSLTLTSNSTTVSVNDGLTIAGALQANGSFTLGDNGDTGSVNTSDWDISVTGDVTGIGNLTTDGRIETAAHANSVGLNIPTNAGAPAGVTGTAEGDLVWDSTNNALYAYDGGSFTQIGGGAYSGWTIDGDDADTQAIASGNTLLIAGGTNGIDTDVSATDTITLNLDTTEIGSTTFGSGSGITWTFDASGGTDTSLAFGDNSITATTNIFNFTGNQDIANHAAIGSTAIIDGVDPNVDTDANNIVTIMDTLTDFSVAETKTGIMNSLIVDPAANSTEGLSGILNYIKTPALNDKNLGNMFGINSSILHQGTGIIDELWGGYIGYSSSNYGNINTGTGLEISAAGATNSKGLQISTEKFDTTSSNTTGIHNAVNNTSITNVGTDTTYGSNNIINRTGATGGTIDTIGQYIGLNTDNSGSGTHTATGLQVTLDGNADVNYSGIFTGGNFGLGDTTPDAPLDVVGDVYISDGLSLYETAVSDGTVEATKFCTGDGESNCVTDFAGLTAGASIWTDSGTITYLTSVTDDLALGGSTSSAPFFFDESAEELILTNTTAGDSFRVNDVASDTTPFLIDASGNVSVGANLTVTETLDVALHSAFGNTGVVDTIDSYHGTTGSNVITLMETVTDLDTNNINSGIYNTINVDPAAISVNGQYGNVTLLKTPAANDKDIDYLTGFDTSIFHDGTGNINNATGGMINVEADSSGTIAYGIGLNVVVSGAVNNYGFNSQVYKSDTTAGSSYGYFGYLSNSSVVTTGFDETFGSDISISRTGATGGTIDTFGQYISLTTDNAGAGTHTAIGLRVYLDGNADVNYSGIFTGGNFGLGDTTPDAPLDVVGDVYISDGLSLYETAVSDGTVEATKFCTGDGETNCVTDFSALTGGTSLFTDGGTITYLTSVTDDLALGGSTSSAPFFFDESAEELILTNTTAGDSFRVNDVASDTTPFLIDTSGKVGIGNATPIGYLDTQGAVTGKALVILNETGDQDILVASSSGTTKFRVANDGYIYGERFADLSNMSYYIDPAAGTTAGILAGNLGVGTTGPDARVDSLSTAGEQLRLTYTDGSTYTGFTTGSGGDLTIVPSGGDISVTGNILPSANDTYDLGSTALRWQDIFLGPNTAHIGTSTTDEGTISYDTAGNIFNFGTDSTTNADIAFFTDDLFLDKSTGRVGVGTAAPATQVEISNAGSNTLRVINSSNNSYVELISGAGSPSLTLYAAGAAIGNVGTNYIGTDIALWARAGRSLVFGTNNAHVGSFDTSGNFLPGTDDTQALGSTSLRWQDIFLGPNTAHIGTSLTDEGTISYDTTGNIFNFGTDSTTNADIAFFTDDLFLDKSTGRVGVGTAAPGFVLDVAGTASVDSLNINSAYTFPTADSTTGYVLSTNGSGTVAWTNPTTLAGTSLFTDAGAVTYLTSQTDDLALGGTSSTAPFFYDESQEELNLENTVGTSSALRLYSNVDATATSNLFYVHVDNPLFDQDAIQVQNDGVGTGIDVNNDGTSYGVDITNGVAATSHALYVRSSANAVAASELARFSVTDAAFDQDVIQLDNAGIGDSLYITQGTTGTGRGLYVYSDVNATSTGPLGEFNVDNVLFDQTALLVSNDGTGASFRVDDVSGDTSPFVVDTSGNVGILNSTPGFNLDVSGTASVDSLNINSAYTLPTADGTSGYVLTTDGLGAVTWAAVAGGSSLFTDGGTITYLTSVTDDLALGGSTSSAPFFFDESAEELILTNTTAGDSFRVNDVASDTTPFLIDTSGNISVGGNLVTIGTNTLGDASADSTTIRGTTTMTDSASGFPLTFGADTSLYRGAANGLYLATGDSLTIVSGSSTQTSPATTTTAHGLTVNSLTTGTGIAIGSTATAITSGKLLTLTKTGASGSVAFTGDIANITYSHTFNGGVAQNSTGNTLDISRAITLNNAGNTHTVSGALLLLADSGTQTAGTLTHTAGIIDATQNYTASTGTAVYFKNYGAGNSFRVDDVSGDTSPFIVDTAGDVGIGTTTTTDKLSVTAAASQDVAVFTTSGGYTLTFDQNGNLYRTGNGAGIYNTDGFMAADTYQSYSTNTDLNVTAQGTGQLVLQGSSSGNVGIGTAAPDSKLHISDASQVSLTLSGTADNSAADIDLFEDYTANAGIYGYNITYNGSVNRFDIGAYDGSASVTTHLSILRASGNVGIGTNNPGSALHVSRTGTADDVLLLQDSSGSCEAQPTTTGLTWSCSSDQRLKTNITDASSVLDYLNNIPLKDYTVIKTGEQVMGPIAQEMQILYPELVHMGDDGYLQVSELTPWQIVKAIQEQQLQIESLSLDETGNIIITGNNPTSYAVSTSNGIADRIASFAETTIAKIKAGAIYTEEITANNIKVNGQILSEYITSVVQTALNNGELISPIDSIATIGSDTSINIASESGSILIKDNANKTVATISDKGELSLLGSLNAEGDATISGSLSANSINTNTIATNTLLTNELNTSTAEINNATVSGTLYANNIDVASARIAALEVGMAQLESIKSNTADIVNATISGTLYANNIYDFENKIATSLQQPGLLDLLTGQNDSSASANYLAELYDTVNSTQFEPIAIEDLDLSLEELNLTSNDIALTGSALFIEKYFKVNGAGYISDSLAVGNNIFVGDSLVIGSNDSTTQIANGVIAYNTPNPTEQILKIQPSGQGSIELLAGVMTLNDTGLVMVNGDIETTGDVKVGKTLLANLIKPTKFGNPLQVQVAGLDTESNEIKESRFEIINEVGSPVATFSAQGKAEFAGGIGVGSEDLSGSEADEPQANRTSGKATIKQGRNEIKIKSSLVSEKSLIYVTAVGSTNNQVLFVKSQVANINGQEGEFVVGFDSTTDNDVTFNWWIVN